jgi:hypothetical protein
VNPGKSADSILHQESPHLKSYIDATVDFKNQRGVGVS